MSDSPAAILYDSSGRALPVQAGVTIPAQTPAILVAGTDGTSARYVSLDTSGRVNLAPGFMLDATFTGRINTQGQKTMAASTPVVVASDQAAMAVKGRMVPQYGTSGQTITITLASLASAAARASTAVDNTSALYEDVLVFIKFTTGATPTATGYVNVYGYGSVDNGTTFPEAITGTDAAVTLTSPPNLQLLAQYNGSATANKTYLCGPISFCRMYGLDKLPARWGIVVQNLSGFAFNATAGNFAVTYQGINRQIL